MQATIRLTPQTVKDFVRITSKCDFDIDIAGNNRYVVDAKSILGVLGLNLNRPVTVTWHGFSPELECFVKSHAMAC